MTEPPGDAKYSEDKRQKYILRPARKVGNSTDIIGHLIGQEVPARARYQDPDPRDLVTIARGFVEDED